MFLATLAVLSLIVPGHAAVERRTLDDFASSAPEQIHIALTENSGEMRVQWATMVGMDVAGSCLWGVTSGTYAKSAAAEKHAYTDGGFTGTLHSCIMTGLESGKQYFYVVKAETLKSQERSFRYVAEEQTLSFLTYGDMRKRLPCVDWMRPT
jgi:hypothetical protein